MVGGLHIVEIEGGRRALVERPDRDPGDDGLHAHRLGIVPRSRCLSSIVHSAPMSCGVPQKRMFGRGERRVNRPARRPPRQAARVAGAHRCPVESVDGLLIGDDAWVRGTNGHGRVTGPDRSTISWASPKPAP